MHAAGPLDIVPIPLVFVMTVVFVLLFLEVGFRLGRRRAASPEVEQEASVGAMANASSRERPTLESARRDVNDDP